MDLYSCLCETLRGEVSQNFDLSLCSLTPKREAEGAKFKEVTKLNSK